MSNHDDADSRQIESWQKKVESEYGENFPFKPAGTSQNTIPLASRDQIWKKRNFRLFIGTITSFFSKTIFVIFVAGGTYGAYKTDFGETSPYQAEKATHLIICWPKHNNLSYLNREALVGRYGEDLGVYYDARYQEVASIALNEKSQVWDDVYWGKYPIIHILGPNAAKVTTLPAVQIRSSNNINRQVCDLSHTPQAYLLADVRAQIDNL